jgi:hypothetical protein
MVLSEKERAALHNARWVVRMQVDDRVQHWSSLREGVITYISRDRKYMVVLFDEKHGGPCEEWRRCGAFQRVK